MNAASTLADLTWPARTERLQLRPASAADAEATWAYRSLESVAQWLPTLPRNRDQHQSMFTDPEKLPHRLIVEQVPDQRGGDSENTVIGDLKFDITDAWAQDEITAQARAVQAEIGWAFHPDFQGNGYATEAVSEAMRIAFDELHLRRVAAYCFAANEPSWRLMERLGMRRESYHVADGLHRSGRWEDGMFYALLASEWRAAELSPATDRRTTDFHKNI